MAAAIVVNALGTLAGLCSMGSFVPQVLKILREKRAEGISLHTYVVTVAGFVLWVAYGVLLGSWPVAASNAVNVVLAGLILLRRWRYGENGAPQSAPAPAADRRQPQ